MQYLYRNYFDNSIPKVLLIQNYWRLLVKSATFSVGLVLSMLYLSSLFSEIPDWLKIYNKAPPQHDGKLKVNRFPIYMKNYYFEISLNNLNRNHVLGICKL